MFFEHEIKVRIVDGILEQSQEWEWFIKYVEEHFEFDKNIKSFADFLNKYRDISDVFVYLTRINEIFNGALKIEKDWLNDVNEMALFYIGEKILNELALNDDFCKIFALLIYSGKIYSQGKEEKNIFLTDIFIYRNMFIKDNIHPFVDEKDTFLQLMNSTNVDLSEQISIFQDNINETKVTSDTFIEKYTDNIYYADCFSFQSFKCDTYNAWEEKYILDMLNVKYQKKKLRPLVTYTDKTFFPDFSFWDNSILIHLKQYFNNDLANFIIESIDYALNEKIPSKKTIDKHFELLNEYYNTLHSSNDKNDWHCSSLEFIITFLNDDAIKDLISKDNFKSYNLSVNLIDDIEILCYLKRNDSLFNKKLKSKVFAYITDKANAIDSINSSNELYEYLSDEDILPVIDKNIFEKISDKFEEVIEQDNSVLVAHLFHEYFLFLMKITNNKNVITTDIKHEIIYIRYLWQDIYYKRCSDNLQCFEYTATIKKEQIDKFNEAVIKYPFLFATTMLKLSSGEMVSLMQNISDNPIFITCNRITISKDFPQKAKLKIDEKHPIDAFYLKEIRNVIEEKSYKFLNILKDEEYFDGIYEDIKESISSNMSLFFKTEELYKIITEYNPSYEILPYNETITLGHLTQFFPILENRIREYGELLGIVSICEDIEKCLRLKEPSRILLKIIEEVYLGTDSLSSAADFFFIHFCMFAENGLNIRNDCVHGNGYRSKHELEYALKITLLCLLMIEARYRRTIHNMLKSSSINLGT